jgi:hypothetical protein
MKSGDLKIWNSYHGKLIVFLINRDSLINDAWYIITIIDNKITRNFCFEDELDEIN